MLSLLREGFNLLFLLDLLEALRLLDLHELLVGFGQVGAHLSDLLLAHDLALLLTLQILLGLPLDQLALKHLLFQLLNEVQFEVLKLLTNVFSICLFEFVFLLELGTHLLIVLSHLLSLNIDPVSFDVFLNLSLAINLLLLSPLLVCNIAHEHLAFESFNHVLVLVHCLVCLLNLLASQFVLIVLLFSVKPSALNLNISNSNVLQPFHSRYSAQTIKPDSDCLL